MACGDRFHSLIVTSTGLSLANPYDDVPSFTDYEEWKERARELSVTAQRQHDALGEVENAATPGSFPVWNAVVDRRNAMVEKYDALPSTFLNFDPATNIASAIAVCLDAACVIDLSNAGIVELGGTPPVIPGAPPARKPDGFFSGAANLATVVAVGGAVVAGAILVSRLRRR